MDTLCPRKRFEIALLFLWYIFKYSAEVLVAFWIKIYDRKKQFFRNWRWNFERKLLKCIVAVTKEQLIRFLNYACVVLRQKEHCLFDFWISANLLISWSILLKFTICVVFLKDNLHVFKTLNSLTSFSIHVLNLQNKIFVQKLINCWSIDQKLFIRSVSLN